MIRLPWLIRSRDTNGTRWFDGGHRAQIKRPVDMGCWVRTHYIGYRGVA